ncbi:MAG: hypothetical protein M3Q76_10200 [Acidobacteriota bacterium]|nr:hypothetical protein [Acidobacteriota bacterium]
MKGPVEDNERATRYLLGELPAEEQSGVEDDYFAPGDAFEQLLAAEDDLIDAYVRGELSATRQVRFESHFLATERRRQRVEFARELRRSVNSLAAASSPARMTRETAATTLSPSWWRSLMTLPRAWPPAARVALATLIVLVAAFTWLVIFKRDATTPAPLTAGQPGGGPPQSEPATSATRTPPPPADTASANRPGTAPAPAAGLKTGGQRESVKPEERAAQRRPKVAPPPRPAATTTVAALTLTPDLIRDTAGAGASQRLVLPKKTDLVRLRLEFSPAERFTSYRAALQTVEGREIFSRRPAPARPSPSGAHAVTFQLPARVLDGGDYLLSLSGVSAGRRNRGVAEYYLTVEKQ